VGESIVIAPTVVVVISAIRRDQLLDEFFQVLNKAGFVLDGCDGGGGAGHEYIYRAMTNLFVLDVLVYLGGDIDDVAETRGRFRERLGANRDHAIELPSAGHSNVP